MPPIKFRRQRPTVKKNQTTDETENGEGSIEATTETEASGAVETLIEDMVRSETAELRQQLTELEAQIEEVDNFARISLNERKVQQNEAKLSEFSESLTAFAEKAFNNINALEDRLDRQSLVLAAILDALGDDVDLSEVRRYENDRLVADTTPDERLAHAIDGDGASVESIDGIGSTYAGRLREAGIETTADLAAADPATVAETAGVSEERAATWIGQA
ncbi:MAG: helix-hairpin-helix domain-containing protein [Natronomonas sp.]